MFLIVGDLITDTKPNPASLEKAQIWFEKTFPRRSSMAKVKEKPKKERKLRRFRVRQNVAPHFEPNPNFDKDAGEDEDNLRDIEYGPGEIVESYRPLDKLFVNKLDPITDSGDRADVQSAGGDVASDTEDDPDKDRPVRDVEDARVNRADRFLTEEELEGKPELKKLAKGKKVDLDDDEEEDEEDEAPKAKKSSKKSEESEDEEEDESEDVTSEFDGASDGGLQVFKDSSGKYRVHEDGEDEPMEGAKKGFTKKSEVKTFIKKQVKE